MFDFNIGPKSTYIKTFCDNFDLTNLIKECTCFKSPENISCIDLSLSNRPEAFKILFLLREVFLIFIR